MKKILPWLLLTLAAPAYAAEYAPESPFIHVSGEAKVSVPPDEVTLTFVLPGTADNYAAALKSTDAKFAQFLTYVDAQKISRDTVTSYEIGVRVERPDSSDSPTPPKPSYYANRKVQIALKDLKLFPGVYDEILSLEVDGDVDVQFKTSQEDDLKKKLLLVATGNARQKADELCASFGMKVDGVHAISEQSFYTIENNFTPPDAEASRRDYMDGIVTGGGGGGGAREYLGPQTIDCVSDIYVIFTIKPAP